MNYDNYKQPKKCRGCYWWEYVDWHKGNEGRCSLPKPWTCKKEENKNEV